MMLWQATPASLWQGRDDSAEAPNALRLFQTIARAERFAPQEMPGDIALLGFACDEGVRRNKGRTGAADGPATLRRALANMASHQGHDRCVDMGTISVDGEQLEAAHQALREAVADCQRAGKRTLVLGGGHETAFGHGAGVLDAFPGEKVGIINLDAHLDLRFADCASSGTPFRQLALECDAQQRGFHYTCIGVSRAANTQALWDEAARRQVAIVEDLEVLTAFETRVLPELERNIAQFDRLYLTIDLDVLPAREMPAVSAPAALGVPLATLLRIVEPLCRSGKLQAVDLVEFNPLFDIDGQGARTAARVAWQIAIGGASDPRYYFRFAAPLIMHKESQAMFAQQPRSAPAPFYEKVKQAISEKIHSGVWRPHDRIPSEAELVAQFGFSRMTINRALRELTDEGLLVRLQGVGTFVAEPKGQSALFEVRSIAAEIVARHHQHRCEVLLLEETRADHIQATALSVPEGTRIFHSLMVHYENEVPVQIEDRCVNAAVVPDYLHQDYTATTPHDYLSLIAPLTEGEHIVEAVQATAEECALLHIHAHDPCLLIRRRTWSTTHIVSHARLLFPGSRYRLQGRFGS
ncbi:Formiminoglutamase [Klebsiella pneumoniae]|nr:Formiminoglutamase [Klebsiella pneumoniae]